MADKYVVFLKENTKDINTVCELGAGVFKNFNDYQCTSKIGIELIPAYVNNREYKNCEAIVGDANNFKTLLDGKVVDAFACIDFLEHLEKEDAIELIKKMQLYTPWNL